MGDAHGTLTFQCDFCLQWVRPVYFMEPERDQHNTLTGRKRRAVSHLECEGCGKKHVIDGTFDGPWH